jgi:hypothetical protein
MGTGGPIVSVKPLPIAPHGGIPERHPRLMQLLLSKQKAVLKPPDTPEFMRGAFQAPDGARRDVLASASFNSGSAASAALMRASSRLVSFSMIVGWLKGVFLADAACVGLGSVTS